MARNAGPRMLARSRGPKLRRKDCTARLGNEGETLRAHIQLSLADRCYDKDTPLRERQIHHDDEGYDSDCGCGSSSSWNRLSGTVGEWSGVEWCCMDAVQ